MNKNNIYKILIPIFVIVIFAPSVTLAAWWNPISWNWKALFSTPTQSEVKVITKEATTTDIATSSQITPSKVEVKKPQQKVIVPQTTKSQEIIQPSNVVNTTPISDPKICEKIDDDERLFINDTSASIKYFKDDLMRIFNETRDTNTTFSKEYQDFVYKRSSFFDRLTDFENKDIVRINSSYLDSSYIQSIKDNLSSLSSGYRDLWDTWQSDLIILENTDVFDSYDKHKAYDIIDKDTKLTNDTNKFWAKAVTLCLQVTDKYQVIRDKYGCEKFKL